MHLSEMEAMNLEELHRIADETEVEAASTMKKKDLIFAILKQETESEGLIFNEGVLEIMSDGYGFLRQVNYLLMRMIFIFPSQIRRFGLRRGVGLREGGLPKKMNAFCYFTCSGG